MNYKLILRSLRFRMTILRLLEWIPDTWMVRIQYRISTGRKLHLKKCTRYTEKLQYYKCFYRNPDMKRCVDKYEVRDYLKEHNLDKYLNDIYGVYDNIYDIDFDSLPQAFVIKTTNGGGNSGVFICRDKTTITQEHIIEKFSNPLWTGKKSPGREWAYYGIKQRFIVERLLLDEGLSDKDIEDYKFFCFNGKVKCIWVDTDRNLDHRRTYYDINWRKMDVRNAYLNTNVKCPHMLEEMISLAEKLSQPFPHVRIDLFNIENKIVFGEFTFYSGSGYESFIPDSFDFELGELFNINFDK